MAQATVDAHDYRRVYGPRTGADTPAGCRTCPHRSLNWSCPPFSRNPFDRALARMPRARITLMAFEAHVADPQLREAADRATAGRARPGDIVFISGPCRICAKCPRPDGQPCPRPDQARTSLQACGFDLEATAARLLNRPLSWQPGAPITYITAILSPD